MYQPSAIDSHHVRTASATCTGCATCCLQATTTVNAVTQVSVSARCTCCVQTCMCSRLQSPPAMLPAVAVVVPVGQAWQNAFTLLAVPPVLNIPWGHSRTTMPAVVLSGTVFGATLVPLGSAQGLLWPEKYRPKPACTKQLLMEA
jgi:hypothetical protein